MRQQRPRLLLEQHRRAEEHLQVHRLASGGLEARRLMQPVRCLGARLARSTRGATLPEFAIILPTFLVLLFGIYDVGQTMYAQSVLQGALQDAGRDASLE